MIDLTKVLINKWNNKSLAHFYILEPPSEVADANNFLLNWTIKILKEFFKSKGLTTDNLLENGHSDLLFIGAPISEDDDLSKDYLLEDFTEFFKFLDYGPLELQHKFVIINNAHRINERISNKLLKSFEEPGKNTTIFLINSDKKNLLPTIKSRGIKLTPNSDIHNDEQLENRYYQSSDQAQWFKQYAPEELSTIILPYLSGELSPFDTVNLIKKKPNMENMLTKWLVKWECTHASNFQLKNNLLEQLKWLKQSQQYHNSSSERIYSLLSAMHKQ